MTDAPKATMGAGLNVPGIFLNELYQRATLNATAILRNRVEEAETLMALINRSTGRLYFRLDSGVATFFVKGDPSVPWDDDVYVGQLLFIDIYKLKETPHSYAIVDQNGIQVLFSNVAILLAYLIVGYYG